ncbi:MAG: hypothetical protein GEU76_07365 [Alphaproteobacteria bacterium]|nr:hypothetical protein [Alphaproteobacteria bacterium]
MPVRKFLGGFIVLAALGLGACVGPTPYGPATDGFGFTEQAIEEDRYRVTFSGNSATPRETVENYLLYRAAEVTLERGHAHFVVVKMDTERTTTYHGSVNDFGGPFGFYGYRSWYDRPYGFGGFASLDAHPIDRYSAYANIVMRKGAKPDDPDAYDARAVIERLGSRIDRQPS